MEDHLKKTMILLRDSMDAHKQILTILDRKDSDDLEAKRKLIHNMMDIIINNIAKRVDDMIFLLE